MTSSIEELFFLHSGNQIDKWEHYIEIYNVEMMRFAQSDRPVSLLEIGVQNGGSLELWSDFLPQGSKIYGVDIDPRVAQLVPSKPNIKIDILDGTSDEMLERFSGQAFDIIIDDGSHVSKDIVESFCKCFRLVRPGGLYIIEDLHAAYYKSHGGGISEPKSAMVFLKGLVDALHFDYIGESQLDDDIDVNFLRQLNRSIARVTFYDSVTVVEKLARPKIEPYRRILSGVTHDAVDMSRWLDALPRPQLATLRLSSEAAEQVDYRLVTLIERLEGERALVEHRNTVLETRVAALESAEKEHLGVREQLGAAKELAASLGRQLDQERAHAQRVIAEMRGKLDRAHAAWDLKRMAVERLKSACRPEARTPLGESRVRS